jgi:hypothetical protein
MFAMQTDGSNRFPDKPEIDYDQEESERFRDNDLTESLINIEDKDIKDLKDYGNDEKYNRYQDSMP